MNKLTWTIENAAGETVWIYDDNVAIRAMEFDGHQAALDWLEKNLDDLRPSYYRIVAKIEQVQE